jgi:beta-N-acetylhexosaminidase
MSYLMMDLAGLVVSEHEAGLLAHAKVGGIILFTRNFGDKAQLKKLVKQVRNIRPELLIAVDHEGGRVQRFRDGFTAIPAMGDILPAAEGDIEQAKLWAKEAGFLMALELVECGIDLSFAPVLDRNGISEVIGKRSFSADPAEIIILANEFIQGMNQAGMAGVGKHFPGHGSVAADSHIAMPVDNRSKDEIISQDMLPFSKLISSNMLAGIMPAHVVYPQVDPNPAGFSRYWLQEVLRNELNFTGVIFSDDLGMKGAHFAGDYLGRAKAALTAGCDMILVCNDPQGVQTLLAQYPWPEAAPLANATDLRLNAKLAKAACSDESRRQQAQALMALIKIKAST